MFKETFFIILCAYVFQGYSQRWEKVSIEPSYYSKRIDPAITKYRQYIDTHNFTTYEELTWYYANYGLVWWLRLPLYALEYWNAGCMTVYQGMVQDYFILKNKI